MRRRSIIRERTQREEVILGEETQNADAGQGRKEVLTCPKCGKSLGRGGRFHVRACKG